MAVIAADLKSRVAELSDGAFETFCDDVSSMYGADVRCRREHAGIDTVAGLRRRFKTLAAVHLVQAAGAFDGRFQLLFDQGGLFVLSGLVVMLPEAKILEQARNGHVDDAESLTDAVREIGNLLVGSWDRVFRDDCEGHDHFAKSGTYIGKPWDNLDAVSLSADEEVLLVLYEMTVDSYPSFHCAALFPQAMVCGEAGAASEPSDVATESAEKAATPLPDVTPQEAPTAGPVDMTPSPPDASEQEHEPAAAGEEPDSVETLVTVTEETPPEAAATVASDPDTVQADTVDFEAAVAPAAAPADDTVSEVALDSTIGILSDERAAALIDRVFEEHTVCPSGTGISDLLSISAREIMTTDVVWCDPDDAVQKVIAAMQEHNAGYVLVGRDGALEGLVSNSNILGAVSPYLRPTFAKWRRPEDDATLGIKIKWVMSRPVRTVKPDVSLATVIESMRRYGGRCLPVVDGQGQVLGIITVFDILLRVLEIDGSSSWQGDPPQGPPLLV